MKRQKFFALIVGATFTLQAHAQLPSYIPSNGLVAYWPFTGNADDKSLNGNQGSVNGPTLTQDRFGNTNQAFLFDGIDDYITVAHTTQLNLTEDLTISAWIRSYSAHSPQRIIDKVTVGNSDSWMLDCGGELKRMRLICGSAVGAQPVSKTNFFEDSIWVNVTVSFDGDTVKFYKNGVLDSTFLHTGTTGGNDNAIRIGANTRLTGEFFHGVIDDVIIWDRELAPGEVSTLYSGGSVGLKNIEIPDLNIFTYDNKIVLDNTGKPRSFKLEVYSIDGRLITTLSIKDLQGKFEKEMELNHGYYLINVTEGNSSITKKVKL